MFPILRPITSPHLQECSSLRGTEEALLDLLWTDYILQVPRPILVFPYHAHPSGDLPARGPDKSCHPQMALWLPSVTRYSNLFMFAEILNQPTVTKSALCWSGLAGSSKDLRGQRKLELLALIHGLLAPPAGSCVKLQATFLTASLGLGEAMGWGGVGGEGRGMGAAVSRGD